MAKLSAHGKELLRIELEKEISDPNDSITWARWTRVYHSDGKILQKYDVRWKADTYHPNGEKYSFGWKLKAKVKPGLDPVKVAAEKAERIRAGIAGPWKILSGGPAPVIISPERIIRAIESGEFIGFCKECGHSQDGCEPDARNYKCENCGAMEVYGAEEMLISA